jgi:hypothetical protein
MGKQNMVKINLKNLERPKYDAIWTDYRYRKYI